MKDDLRSSVVSVPSFLKFQGKMSDRVPGTLVDTLTPLNLNPQKNGDSTKMVQQLKNRGVQEVGGGKEPFFCVKSYLHRALIYPAMALEGSQIHWPCRLHGRVIILNALEMWI